MPSVGEAEQSDDGGIGARLNALLDRIDSAQHRWTPVAFVVGVVKKFTEDGGGRLGALIAYYGLLSLFPLVIVLVTALGFVLEGRPGLREEIVDSALAQFPLIGDELDDPTAITGRGLTLVFGVVGALWAGLGALNATEAAFDTVFNIPRFRRADPVSRRLRALRMLAILGLALVVATFLANAGQLFPALGSAVAIPLEVASVMLYIGVFVLAYRTLTSVDLSSREVFPGAVLAGVAWWALVTLGVRFAGELEGSTDTYGGVATVIGLLTWIYVQAQITIIGAEVNAVYQGRLWPRSLGPGLTEADVRAFRRHADTERFREEITIDVRIDGVLEPGFDRPAAGQSPTDADQRR